MTSAHHHRLTSATTGLNNPIKLLTTCRVPSPRPAPPPDRYRDPAAAALGTPASPLASFLAHHRGGHQRKEAFVGSKASLVNKKKM